MNRLALGVRIVVAFSAVALGGCGGSGVPTAGGGHAGMGGAIATNVGGAGGGGSASAGAPGQGGGPSAVGGRAGAAAAGGSGGGGGAVGPGGAVGYGGASAAGGANAAGGASPDPGATGGAAAAGGRGGALGGPSSGGGTSGGGGTGGPLGGATGGATGGAAGATSSMGGASGHGGGGGATGAAGGAGGAGSIAPSCEAPTPCGGSLVGSWRFVSICLDEVDLSGIGDQLVPTCPAATITNVATSHTGSIAFTASDYTATASTTLSFTLTLPISCLGGAVTSCADLGSRLASNPSLVSASCSGSTVCACALANTPVVTSASGSYVTAGATVTFLPTNGAPNDASYCVNGDRLHILDVETTTDMGSTVMRTRSDEIADRQ